jgi:excisionase family DNA binding protein
VIIMTTEHEPTVPTGTEEEHAVDVVAADGEVSAQEAADILKVSRPYLLNLVKKGILPCRMVGAHYRIPTGALIAYKRGQVPRHRSIEALSAETQDPGPLSHKALFQRPWCVGCNKRSALHHLM